MRKAQVVLLVILAVGALTAGIGAGAAFGEYSSMEYEGTVVMGEENWKTETFECEWEPEEGKTLQLNLYNYPWSWNTELTEDESVPVNTVAVDFTYNEELYEPRVSIEPVEMIYEEAEGTEAMMPRKDQLQIWFSYCGSEFDVLMENKDQMLSMLKEKKLASFEMAAIKDVKIRVNPEMTEYLEINRGW